MHLKAEEWDELNGNRASSHLIKGDKFIPINRPCDWCGAVVDEGYIHNTCLREEASFLIETLGL